MKRNAFSKIIQKLIDPNVPFFVYIKRKFEFSKGRSHGIFFNVTVRDDLYFILFDVIAYIQNMFSLIYFYKINKTGYQRLVYWTQYNLFNQIILICVSYIFSRKSVCFCLIRLMNSWLIYIALNVKDSIEKLFCHNVLLCFY